MKWTGFRSNIGQISQRKVSDDDNEVNSQIITRVALSQKQVEITKIQITWNFFFYN